MKNILILLVVSCSMSYATGSTGKFQDAYADVQKQVVDYNRLLSFIGEGKVDDLTAYVEAHTVDLNFVPTECCQHAACNSLLSLAVKYGCASAVRVLLLKGASPSIKFCGRGGLIDIVHVAIHNVVRAGGGNQDVLQALLQAKVSIEDPVWCVRMLQAAGKSDLVKDFIAHVEVPVSPLLGVPLTAQEVYSKGSFDDLSCCYADNRLQK